jgi:thiol-disulfide isomerase/thioredoxin
VLTGAALGGASVRTSLLLLAYAAGAATPLAGALLAGGRLFKAMKQSLGAGEWIRRGIGAALLCGVAAIALGLDTGVLAQLSLAGTSSVEQALIDRVRPREAAPSGDEAPLATTGPDSTVMMAGSNAMMAANAAMRAEGAAATALPAEGPAPSLDGAVQWLNSPPLSMEALRGKVVLIDFWTYSCINCLRALPYVRAWAEKYKDEGLVVIGVHAPEFAFEKKLDNVRKAVKDLKLDYPVAVDNDYAIWRAFKNEYWPAHYFIDARGRIRHHHFGEGAYDESEQVIRQLLAEAGRGTMPGGLVQVEAQGAQAAADSANVRSPETYIGYERAENFVSPGGPVRGKAHAYTAPSRLEANQWALGGNWTVGGQSAVLDKARGRIAYRFHARDLHLVLGSTAPGHPVRIKVTIDGKPPGEDHGIDIDAQGKGVVDGQRLYQLVRQRGAVADRRFEIEFLDPGVEAFAFTFG